VPKFGTTLDWKRYKAAIATQDKEVFIGVSFRYPGYGYVIQVVYDKYGRAIELEVFTADEENDSY